MDWQSAFNIAIGVAGMLTLLWVNTQQSAVKKLEQGNADLRVHLSDNYAKKDDVRDLANDLKAVLLRIENKLDTKADKHGQSTTV